MIFNPVLCVACWSATSDVVSSNNAARDATPTTTGQTAFVLILLLVTFAFNPFTKKGAMQSILGLKDCSQKYFNIEEKKRGNFILVTSSTISVYSHLVSFLLDNFVSQETIKNRIRTRPYPKMISSWSKHHTYHIWGLFERCKWSSTRVLPILI